MRFRTKGAYAVAFSGDMQSKCARAAQVTVDISTPTVNIERGLPLRGYAATLLAFCGVAWRIAILQGRKSEAERLAFYEDLVVSADELQKTLPEIEHQVSDFARKVYQTASVYELVGSGTGFTSAWLGRQELVGQAGDDSHCADLAAELTCPQPSGRGGRIYDISAASTLRDWSEHQRSDKCDKPALYRQ